MTPPEPSYCEIPLTKGQVAHISPKDFEWVSKLKWSAIWNPYTRSYYAVNLRWDSENKTTRPHYMHRMILSLEVGDKRQGDHIDRNTLNNIRENLRIATQTQNAANAKLRKDNSSGFKGVFMRKGRTKLPWFASARINGRSKYLGSFNTPEEASRAYIEFCSRLHGEFFRPS